MGMGMVRKIDELGRVVVPKEMRRILGIKTGSSVEMIINDDRQIVIKKFYELEGGVEFASELCDTIFNSVGVQNIICDEDKIVASKGVKLAQQEGMVEKISHSPLLEYCESNVIGTKYMYILALKNDGYEEGRVAVFLNEKDEVKIAQINLLVTFASTFLKG